MVRVCICLNSARWCCERRVCISVSLLRKPAERALCASRTVEVGGCGGWVRGRALAGLEAGDSLAVLSWSLFSTAREKRAC
jgi:hypothetical protein